MVDIFSFSSSESIQGICVSLAYLSRSINVTHITLRIKSENHEGTDTAQTKRLGKVVVFLETNRSRSLTSAVGLTLSDKLFLSETLETSRGVMERDAPMTGSKPAAYLRYDNIVLTSGVFEFRRFATSLICRSKSAMTSISNDRSHFRNAGEIFERESRERNDTLSVFFETLNDFRRYFKRVNSRGNAVDDSCR